MQRKVNDLENRTRETYTQGDSESNFQLKRVEARGQGTTSSEGWRILQIKGPEFTKTVLLQEERLTGAGPQQLLK